MKIPKWITFKMRLFFLLLENTFGIHKTKKKYAQKDIQNCQSFFKIEGSLFLKKFPTFALLSSEPSFSSKSFATDVYQLYILIIYLPVPTCEEGALSDNSLSFKFYFWKDSLTFACSASHVFLASPRSMAVLGL